MIRIVRGDGFCRMLATGVPAWPGAWRTAIAGLMLSLTLSLLAGCTSLPQVDRYASEAVPLSTQTALGKIAQASIPSPELSGFRLMPLGSFSLDTRLQLARRAEATLDLQYYQFQDDETGRLLLRAVADAAKRGVRVRLLLDDFYTSGSDTLFLGLAAYPNVEVRLFNPFCCARDSGQLTRFAASFGDWSRVNHRMHNKLFIADGAMAVIGGRNVANEYFQRSMAENFVDVDAFTVGFILPPLQELFDRYWNSFSAYPLETIAKTDLSKEQLLARFDERTGPRNTPQPDALGPNDILGYGPIADDLDEGKLGLIWGEAFVFADHPDKPFESKAGSDPLETSVTYNVAEQMRKAKTQVVASSPYFVPGKRGMRLMQSLRDKGVKLQVLTNSLAATDEYIVHAGYSRYREDMLKMGVDLYELSRSRLKMNKRPFHFGSSLGRLHAKVVVIDKHLSFIGSMNLDPRSASVNTELGAIIESPALAKELLNIIDIDRLQSAYRVRLSPTGHGLEWLTADDEKEMILDKEPDSTPWLRLKLWLLGPLVPEELL
ncbi:phospholipase D family protein [Undibacterium sp.]|uniref:phospholipase D family protein n=1 Tax=Undibacterium sp. TaxID=1914977 RepID=UPI002CF6AB4E|nr:phospholipase D family protein [Undibacterium sp.]HTD06278.1 phospholipase D family protein [Undibacterium sp.]